MVSSKRAARLNSLLKEVISEVIRDDVRNPKVSEFLTITNVEITKDLQFAKVFISIIGTEESRQETLKALKSAAKYIGFTASKKVVLRHFPKLSFYLDDSVENYSRVENILKRIQDEKEQRASQTS